MKTCGACQVEKPLGQFGINRSRKDGLQTQCKACRKTTNQKYYQSSKDVQNPKRRATRNALIQKNRSSVVEYLRSHPCVDCGNADIRVLEFDHVYGEKEFDISRGLRNCRWDVILLEIQKCQVRCANCHRIVTGNRGGWYKSEHMPL